MFAGCNTGGDLPAIAATRYARQIASLASRLLFLPVDRVAHAQRATFGIGVRRSGVGPLNQHLGELFDQAIFAGLLKTM